MYSSEGNSGYLRFWYVWPALAAFVVVIPMMIWGYPRAAHDFYYHCNTWLEAGMQFRQGHILPRWAALANYGYGEPRFIFYPPLSWISGGLLSLVLPWKFVPGVFVWLALTGSGLAMYRLAVEWLPARFALLAALVYLTNPYQLMVVYWRWAAAELLVAALAPLMILFALRTDGEVRRTFLPLAAVFAAVCLTNAPGSVILGYSAALVLALVSLQTRSFRPLWRGGAALALGLGLAGFYILPAFHEQTWVQIKSALSYDLLPEHNFVVLSPPRNARFIAVAGINAALGLVLAGVAILRRRSMPWMWSILAILALVAAALIFPFSYFLWEYVPKLRYVQLPWRWLFVVNVTAAMLLAAICQSLRKKTRMAVVLFVFVLFCVMLGVARITKGQPGRADSIRATIQRDGYWGVPEYLPEGVAFPLQMGRPLFVAKNAGMQELPDFPRGQQIQLRTDFTAAGELKMPIWWYPAWQAEVDGAPAPVLNRDGRIAIQLTPGPHAIVVSFGRTGDRLAGAAISLGSLMIGVVVFVAFRYSSKAACRTERAHVITCPGV